MSDPSLSRDNSRVVEVIVDDLITRTEFLHSENLILFHKMNKGFLHGKVIFLPSN